MTAKRTWTFKRVLFVLFLVMAAGVAYWIFRPGAGIEPGSVLVVDLRQAIPEEPAPGLPGLSSGGPNLRDLVRAVDQAAGDDRVAALLLKLGGSMAGSAQAAELRAAVAAFRTAGKPVYAYADVVTMGDLRLGTAAERFYILPTAFVLAVGIDAQMQYLRGTLDKLEIEPEFIQIGGYKGAEEMFMRTGMSDEFRAQFTLLLTDLFEQFLAQCCEARSATPDKLRAVIDHPTLLPASLVEIGIVDGLHYFDEIRQELEERIGKEPELIEAGKYLNPSGLNLHLDAFGGDAIGLIYAVGEIHLGESTPGLFRSPTIGSDTMGEALRKAREDEAVKAVVLRVNSPGGSGMASDAIWREIDLTRREKPVVTSVGGMAASGGYYISMGTDRIVADPSSILGSIGVVSGNFNLRGFFAKLGMSFDGVKLGENADMFSMTHSMTEEQRSILRGASQAFYDDFAAKVARGRNLTIEQVQPLAQGKLWSGRQSVENGLADELGGLEQAIRVAKVRAGFDEDADLRIKVLPEKEGLAQLLAGLGASARQAAELAGELARWRRLQAGLANEPCLAIEPALLPGGFATP